MENGQKCCGLLRISELYHEYNVANGCPLKWLWDCQLDNSNKKKDILPARVDIGSFNLICLGDCDRLGVRKLRLKFSSSPSSAVFSSVHALKSNKYKVCIPNSSYFLTSNQQILLEKMINFKKRKFNSMFFSDLLCDKIVVLIEKHFWNLRLKAKNLQNFCDH